MSTNNLWLEADTLPPVFEEKKALLDGLLKRAIGGLLLESRQRNILTSPYGRPEQPTPLLSLEQFLKNGGLSEPIDGSTNDEPIFSYEYGFDPLKYLADYLKFLHPKNIKQMRDVRNDACNFLRSRAAHAQAQMRCMYDLHDLIRRLRSGIVWGPLVAPSTMPTSAAGTLICACKAAKCGDIVVEVATEPSFLAVERSWKQKVRDESLIQKLALANLEPAQTYFLRCYLIRDGEVGDGDSGSSSSDRGAIAGTDVSPAEGTAEGAVIEDGQVGVAERFFQSCQFTVAPADEEGATSTVQVVAVNARSAHAAASTIGELAGAGIGTRDLADAPSGRASCCTTCCFLGELLPPSKRLKSSSVSAYHEHQLGSADSDDGWIQHMSFSLHRYARAFSDPETVLRSTSMLMAWHDRTVDSDARLGEEEACIKRFLSDLGKYQKKHGKGANKAAAAAAKNKRGGTAADAVPTAPKLQRPALGTSMEAILQALPLEVDGQAAAKTAESTDSTSTGTVTSACVRQFYYTQMLGPKVQLLVLDYRRGYLGKEQVSWLTEMLKSSPATWKLILSGAPFGVGMSMAPALAPTDPLAGEPANNESSVTEEQAASETKDHAGEVGRVATSGEMQEQEQESNDIGTGGAPIAGSGVPTVTMTLPPPIEAAGWDEDGRLKLSLQSVIAGLQKAAIADKREKLRLQREQVESKTGEAGDGSVSGVPVALVQDCVVDNEGDEKIVDDRLLVESGIVILSSGACIPEDCAKVVPKMLLLGAEVPPFAATYDPCESGAAFCMEICIGGGEGFSAVDLMDSAVWTGDSDAAVEERDRNNQSPVVTAGHTPRPKEDAPAAKGTILQPAASLHPIVSASLGTRVIFGLGDDDDHLSLACASTASLASDDASLNVRIVTVLPDGGHAPLFACTLRCGASFVSNAE